MRPSRAWRTPGSDRGRPGPRRTPGSTRVLVAVVVGCACVLAVTLPLAVRRSADGAAAAQPGPNAGEGIRAEGGATAQLLAVLALVVLAAHVGGLLARWCRQPPVVGQLTVGLLVGPSVLGAVFPGLLGPLFGGDVLPHLRLVGELGLTFFLVQVGHELAGVSGRAASRSLLLAGVGVLVPFSLGAVIALAAYESLAPEDAGLVPFTGFVGLALSATALPVLAKILADRMPGDRLNGLVLPAAVFTDGLVWLGMAALSITLAGGGSGLVGPVAAVAGLAAVLPLRRALGRAATGLAAVPPAAVLAALVVAVLLVGAGSAAALGSPGLGAIACGLALPVGVPVLETALRHLRTVTDALLLPVFFALAGLGVRLGAVTGTAGLTLLGVLLTAAVAGKLGGCALAARVQGWSWPTAARIGVLMNCRGVTELVLVSIGASLGLVGDRLYSILVLLALGSTALTGPLLGLVDRLDRSRRVGPDPRTVPA